MLRAGFVTSAADRGADLNSIVDVFRHVDAGAVRTCIQRADRYKGTCGGWFPLVVEAERGYHSG